MEHVTTRPVPETRFVLRMRKIASTSCLYDKTIYGNFIKKILDISLQLSGFDVIIYFSDHGFDKDKAYFIQLLILTGKFHTHKMKWSGSERNFFFTFECFPLYCSDVWHNKIKTKEKKFYANFRQL